MQITCLCTKFCTPLFFRVLRTVLWWYYIHSFTVHWRTEVKNDFIYHYSASADKTELKSFFSSDLRKSATIQRQSFARVISYLDGFLSSISKVTFFPGQQISLNQNWDSIFPLKNLALINHYKKPKVAEIYWITETLTMPDFVKIGQLLQTL